MPEAVRPIRPTYEARRDHVKPFANSAAERSPLTWRSIGSDAVRAGRLVRGISLAMCILPLSWHRWSLVTGNEY
jgi:hypothetical protein